MWAFGETGRRAILKSLSPKGGVSSNLTMPTRILVVDKHYIVVYDLKMWSKIKGYLAYNEKVLNDFLPQNLQMSSNWLGKLTFNQ